MVRRVLHLIGLSAVLIATTLGWGKEKASKTQMAFPPGLKRSGTVSAQELLTSAQKLLPKDAFLGPLLDKRYSVIKYEWLVDTFIPYYQEAVEVLKTVADGKTEGSDCDDFGLFLRQTIGLSGVVGRVASPAAAQVVVFQSRAFSGVGITRERHMVGLVLTDRGWYVIEPQNAQKLEPVDHYSNRRGIQYITFH
ncbi:MAG: hypothetical protein JNN01_17140 [Opitutaceae bacterium]|nr:hypothetical protein [Opitutaceae bacterium]